MTERELLTLLDVLTSLLRSVQMVLMVWGWMWLQEKWMAYRQQAGGAQNPPPPVTSEGGRSPLSLGDATSVGRPGQMIQ